VLVIVLSKCRAGYSLTEIQRCGIVSRMNLLNCVVLFALLVSGVARGGAPLAKARPQEPTQMLTLQFLKLEEALRALRTAFPLEDFRVEKGRVVLQCAPAQIEPIRNLMERIDSPPCGCPTKFIDITFGDATEIADELQFICAWDPEFHAIPQPRTSRVFLMGSVDSIELATAFVANLDSAPAVGPI
jgi:hypothetical protein